jgi:fibronectin-binding autotransporter adhesin
MHRKTFLATMWALVFFLSHNTLATQPEQPTYYWNPPNGGFGAWSAFNPVWSTNPLGPANQYWSSTGGTAPYDAVFGGVADTIFMVNHNTANILRFESSGYVLWPGAALTVNGFDTGAHSATVLPEISSINGISKYGSGALELVPAYLTTSGPVRVQEGTLRLNVSFSLPGIVPAIVHEGATLEFLGPSGSTSGFYFDVAVMPSATVRIVPPSGTFQKLVNVYLAGGALIGASGGSTSHDIRVNGAIVTRGTTASMIDANNGIRFTIPPPSPSMPYNPLVVNDVTRDDQVDLTIKGTATWGALQPESSNSNFEKSGSGTLTIDARNTELSRFSISHGAVRLEGASTQNRLGDGSLVGVGLAGVLQFADTDVVPGVHLELAGGKLQIIGENTGRNLLRTLTFSNGGVVETVGTVSATNSENLRLDGAITVTNPSLMRVPAAIINLSHGMGSFGPVEFNVANTTRDAEADLVFTGTGSVVGSGLNKTGAGTLRMETLNTYLGPTTITGGVLSVSTISNGGVPSGVGQSTSISGNLVIANGGTLRYTGASNTTDRGFSGAYGAIEIERADATLTWTGHSHASYWTKLGPGTLEFVGFKNFTGGISVGDGILRFSGSGATLSSVNQTFVYGATGLVHGSGSGPFHQIRNGVLQFDFPVGNLASPQTILNGGTLLYKPDGAGTQATTMSSVWLSSGFNTLAVAPSSGPDQLTITNLTRSSRATVEFRSQFGPLGSIGDNGKIVVMNVDGGPVTNVNGILGGWAIANNPAVGQAGTSASDWFATNLGSGNIGAFTNYAGTQTSTNAFSSATSTQNWWINGGVAANRTINTNKTVHSLITGGDNQGDGDLVIDNFAPLMLGSGGLIMRGTNHTISGSGNIMSGMSSGELFLHAPAELQDADNMRLAVRLTNNGFTPGILIKDGPGEVIIDTSTSHTGGTRIHQGRLTVANQSALTNNTVTVLPGGQVNVSDGIFSSIGVNLSGAGIGPGDGLNSALRFAGSGSVGGVVLTTDSRIGVEGTASTFTVTGAGGLEKVGPGTLQITQGATYLGPTTISEGTLSIQGSATFANTPSINIADSGTLRLGSSFVFGSSNPGNLVVNGGTVITAAGTTNEVSTLTMNGGTVTVNPSSGLTYYVQTGNASLSTLPNAQAATIDGAGIGIHFNRPFLPITVADGPAASDLVIDGFLGTTSSFESLGVTSHKYGEGAMVLAGNTHNRGLQLHNYTGTTELAKTSSAGVHAVGSRADALSLLGGTLRLGGTGGDQIPAMTNVVVDSGVFDFNGRDESFNGLTGQSGVILNDAVGTTSTMTIGEMNGSSSWYGAVEDGAGAMAVTKVGTGTITLGGHNTFSGGARVLGGTLKFEGTLADSSSQNVQVAIDPDGNFATAGPTIVFERLRNDSYAGLGSQAIGGFNSQADLLAGTNSGGTDVNVIMQWRTRTASESTVPTIPPLPPDGAPLASDVLSLTGMVNNQLPSGQSDNFVLQMSYSTADLAGFSEGALVLGWLDPNGAGVGIPQWRAAIDGNYGTNSGTRFAGSWQSAGSPLTLGAWGIDTTQDVVWAVLNHNSQFAVIPVPEPTAALLAWLAAGIFFGWGRRYRRNR